MCKCKKLLSIIRVALHKEIKMLLNWWQKQYINLFSLKTLFKYISYWKNQSFIETQITVLKSWFSTTTNYIRFHYHLNKCFTCGGKGLSRWQSTPSQLCLLKKKRFYCWFESSSFVELHQSGIFISNLLLTQLLGWLIWFSFFFFFLMHFMVTC